MRLSTLAALRRDREQFFLLEVGRSYHSTQFWTCLFLLLIFFVYCCQLSLRSFSTLGWHPTQLTFSIRFLKFNPVCLLYFVRVTSPPSEHFSVQTLTCPCYLVHSFSLQWVPHFTLLGTSAPQTFGLCLLFLNFTLWPVMILPTLSRRQQLPRPNFVPMMNRNLTFGSASSRPSSQWQGSNLKN